VSREDDLEVEVFERRTKPIDGRVGLRWRGDRLSSDVEGLVDAGEELAEEDAEAVGARLRCTLDDRAREGRGRDGEGGERETVATDGTN
jgi:hypothetical protein